jgi:TPR repeat protein
MMARYELFSLEPNGLAGAGVSADVFFQLGMAYATGRSVEADRVAAHKWFNIAAVKGSQDAIRLRRELAGEMSEAEIAAAQRAAREWLKVN